jgi:hypothetical protein
MGKLFGVLKAGAFVAAGAMGLHYGQKQWGSIEDFSDNLREKAVSLIQQDLTFRTDNEQFTDYVIKSNQLSQEFSFATGVNPRDDKNSPHFVNVSGESQFVFNSHAFKYQVDQISELAIMALELNSLTNLRQLPENEYDFRRATFIVRDRIEYLLKHESFASGESLKEFNKLRQLGEDISAILPADSRYY